MNPVWIKHALVGVNGPLPAAPALDNDGEVDALLAEIGKQGDDPALHFSRAAGALGACRLAAVALTPSSDTVPAPASDDPHALDIAHPWSAALADVFADAPLRVQYLACQRLAEHAAHLPTTVVPRALDAGRRSVPLRAVLPPVLGSRGKWLAQFNPEWKFAAPTATAALAEDDSGKRWEEGSFDERLLHLRELRARDPAAARALLQSQLGEFAAKERLSFVEALADGLHDDDEALLQPLLKDRSRDVKLAAAMLLARLPASEHAKRLIGWVAPLVTSKRNLIGRTSWQCEAPQALDSAWAAAAVDGKRPQYEALGERGWWLYQLVRQVPLSWWSTHTGMSATELIAWAGKTDWKEALRRGWRERVGADDRDWIEAMLDAGGKAVGGDRAGLLALLPTPLRERHWPKTLDELCRQGLVADVVGSCALGETLSPTYSRVLLLGLRMAMGNDRLRHDYYLRSQLLELAAVLHPDCLSSWQTTPRRGDETTAMAESIHDIERVLSIRLALLC